MFELIIVDNASTDATALVCAQYSSYFPHCRVLYEAQLGSSKARNTGLAAATTAWVCFVDDDALVAETYVETALATIHTQTFDCFGGKIVPWKRDPLPPWFIDAYESTGAAFPLVPSLLPPTLFASGGNMAVRRAVLADIGGFDSHYGLNGTRLGYGEETELQVRMRKVGYTIGYNPDLLVYHYAKPQRYTFKEQYIVRYKSGISWQMLHNASGVTALLGLLARLVLSPAKGCVVSLHKLYAGEYYWQNAVLEITGRFIHTLGRIHGWWLLQARNKATGA